VSENYVHIYNFDTFESNRVYFGVYVYHMFAGGVLLY